MRKVEIYALGTKTTNFVRDDDDNGARDYQGSQSSFESEEYLLPHVTYYIYILFPICIVYCVGTEKIGVFRPRVRLQYESKRAVPSRRCGRFAI